MNRNKVKSRNLNMINSTSKISNIIIAVYYFSCNLDHVLHDVRNLEQSLKEEYAIEFADCYEGREADFIKFVHNDLINLSDEYSDSWKQIKIGLNSLMRYSNFYQFFVDNYIYLKDEVRLLVNIKE